MSRPSRVAIIGGSIAGCTLANGLVRHPNVEFDVFESKPSFKERGAEVSFAVNAQRALKAMGMDPDEAFRDAGAVVVNSTYGRAASGPHKGKLLFKLPGGIQAVARDRWLEQLLKPLPQDRLHANKHLTSITQVGGDSAPYTLHFADGTTFEADAVIGCDGARSKVRELIIGREHPDKVKALFGGAWDARGKLSPKRAVELFGTELFDPKDPDEVCLIGEGALLLCVPSDGGDVYHVIVSALAGPNYDSSVWKTAITREFLEESYKDWEENFRAGIIESLVGEDTGPGTVFSQWESPETHTYCHGRLSIMGDAAHSTTPWCGQGAAMATEDGSVMAALLGAVQSPEELDAAMRAFDRIRRGRPEIVIENSRKAAKLLTGQYGLDPAKVEPLEPVKWWTDVWDIDMDAHIKDAVDCFHRLKVATVA